MRMTVLGGSGAWPTADAACSGFLLQHDNFSLLIDAGYAVLPRVLELMPADQLDAVYITHGHPDLSSRTGGWLAARAECAPASGLTKQGS